MVATSTTPGGSVVGPATSQLQARLSQPPAAPGNREQLRYLLQRGPNSAAASVTSEAPQAASVTVANPVQANPQVNQANTAAASGVTTTKVWVPGELENTS